MMQALKTVVKYSGVPGLWMGLGSTLLRDVPFSAIYWLNYETIKQKFRGLQHNFTFNLAAGAMAGSVSISLVFLFNLKTRRMYASNCTVYAYFSYR